VDDGGLEPGAGQVQEAEWRPADQETSAGAQVGQAPHLITQDAENEDVADSAISGISGGPDAGLSDSVDNK
jgi:hypothetical protein